MTGFRLHLQGAQGLYGIAPDLTTLGKVIGGGMPVGRVRRQPCHHGKDRAARPRLSGGHALGQSGRGGGGAGDAAGDTGARLPRTGLPQRTLALTTGLAGAARRAGVEFSAQAIGGMFGIYFARSAPDSFAEVMACDKERFNRFFHRMLDAGVYLAPSAYEAGFVSAAHCAADIDETVRRAEACMRAAD